MHEFPTTPTSYAPIASPFHIKPTPVLHTQPRPVEDLVNACSPRNADQLTTERDSDDHCAGEDPCEQLLPPTAEQPKSIDFI